MLADKVQFLVAANEPTVIDIIYYNDLVTALFLMRVKGFKRQYPLTERWITLMGEVHELIDGQEKLAEIIEKYELE